MLHRAGEIPDNNVENTMARTAAVFNPENYLHSFGAIVLRLRKELGFSQEYCAEIAGVHRNTINAVERGCIDLTCGTMTNLCLSLGVEHIAIDYFNKSLHCNKTGPSHPLFPEAMVYESLGSFIESLRGEHGISRETLSDRIGIHRSTIARMENAKTATRASALLRLYRYFGIVDAYRVPGESLPDDRCTAYGLSLRCIDTGRIYGIFL